tara:strand:- start:8974 stop:9405 length:432 start_codon:yes stop_codon:yes gene_type:complete
MQYVTLSGFFFCLISICIFDLYKRRIPNLLIVLLFLVLVSANLIGQLNYHVSSFLVVAVSSLLLWKIGVWGAGDVKLLAVLSLFTSPDFLLTSIVVVLVVGGGVALCELLASKIWSSRETKGVPYGLAICVGGCIGILASISS